MKLSIVISIFNSHEIVRRQILHWEKMGIPDDVEILIMDDGSNPPLEYHQKNSTGLFHCPTCKGLKSTAYYTPYSCGRIKCTECDNKEKATIRIIPVLNPRNDDGIFYDGRVSIARNLGARLAQGEFLLMTDIDYIIRRENIEAVRNCKHDKIRFKRQFGVITEDGEVTQDLTELRKYGLTEDRLTNRGLDIAPHPNNFIMRRSTFLDMGGYRENLQGVYPSRGDTWFKRDWVEYMNSGKGTEQPAEERTTLLMFPNGQFCGDLDYNPFGLFHNFTRKTSKNPYHGSKK